MNSVSLDLYDQRLPYSPEAEQSILGSVFFGVDNLAQALETLTPECFYLPQNRAIYEIMSEMFLESKPIDIVTVLEAVREASIFENDEDAKLYLATLAQTVPTVSNLASYIEIVRNHYYSRRLLETAGEIITDTQNSSASAEELIDMAEQKIYDIRHGKMVNSLTKAGDMILKTYDMLQKLSSENKENYQGISTGFKSLDKLIGGLNRSDLILIAARPAMGKTSFAMNIAMNAAKSGKTVAVFSLEMSCEQLAMRLIASEGLLDGTKLRDGELSPRDWSKVQNAANVIAESPLYIDDTSAVTVGQIKAKLRRMRKLDLVVIDYLQLLSSSGRHENRVQEVSAMTRALKIMARELDVPVVVLSQLSRGPETRSLENRRPQLSDLRESGSIEQDADVVLFLYREAYYIKETQEHNVAECIVGKNRHGATGTAKLGWNDQQTRFSEMEYREYDR